MPARTQAEGDYCTSVGLPIDKLPKGQAFIDAFKAKYPNDEIAAYDAYAYDATNVIIIAHRSRSPRRRVPTRSRSPAGKDAIIAAVAATNTEGVTGAISFDENGDTTNKAITIYQVKEWRVDPVAVPASSERARVTAQHPSGRAP